MKLYVKRENEPWSDAVEVEALSFAADECETAASNVVAQELYEWASEEPHAEHSRALEVSPHARGGVSRRVVVSVRMRPELFARVGRPGKASE